MPNLILTVRTPRQPQNRLKLPPRHFHAISHSHNLLMKMAPHHAAALHQSRQTRLRLPVQCLSAFEWDFPKGIYGIPEPLQTASVHDHKWTRKNPGSNQQLTTRQLACDQHMTRKQRADDEQLARKQPTRDHQLTSCKSSLVLTSVFVSLHVQGPPGTGKTTSVLALAHEMLGPSYKDAVLELNASDDRSAAGPVCQVSIRASLPGRHRGQHDKSAAENPSQWRSL